MSKQMSSKYKQNERSPIQLKHRSAETRGKSHGTKLQKSGSRRSSASTASDSKNVLVAIENAKIYGYASNSNNLRRTKSIDSTSGHSLRRIDSIDSIRSNISEILSIENTTSTTLNVEEPDESFNSKHSSALNSKGRLLAHGILSIYEIEGGIPYISCGGRNNREAFVHPLLPRLKIFKVDGLTFILMLSHPERFWKIVFDDTRSTSEDYLSQIEELERSLTKICSFVDLFPKKLDNTAGLKTKEVAKREPKKIELQAAIPVKKGKLGNRLSKFFKTKSKKSEGDEDSFSSGNSPRRSIQTDNSSSGQKATDNDNSGDNGNKENDYNAMIDKLIEERVEKKLSKQLQKNQKEQDSNFDTNSLTETVSNDSILYQIIEENKDAMDEIDNQQYLNKLSERLNNDVNDEIFKLKRRSIYDENFHIMPARPNSLYGNSSWIESKKYKDDDFEEENSELLMMVKSGTEQRTTAVLKSTVPKRVRAPVVYQPHNFGDDRRSLYSFKTFKTRNRGSVYRDDNFDRKSFHSLRTAGFGAVSEASFKSRATTANKKNEIKSKQIFDIITDEVEEELKSKEQGFISRVFGW